MFRLVKKLNLYLTLQEKKKLIVIMFLMILGALLDMLSVSIIVPVVSIVLDTDSWDTKQYMIIIRDYLGIYDVQSFTIVILLTTVGIFILRAVVTMCQTCLEIRLTSGITVKRKQELMLDIMSLPYQYFTSTNSEEIRRTLTSDVDSSFDVVTSFIAFLTSLISIINVGVVVFLIDWKMALSSTIILGIEVLIVNGKLKKSLYNNGLELRTQSVETGKWLIQSIVGIKEIKASDYQEYFVDECASGLKKFANLQVKNTLFQKLPHQIIEAGTISVVLLYMSVYTWINGDLASIATSVSAFAVAAVRLIPAAKGVTSAITNMTSKESALDELMLISARIKEMTQDEINMKKSFAESNNSIPNRNGFGFCNVTFKYDTGELPVLKNVSLEIPYGSSVGIIGVSGGGKTTTIDLLLGLLEPNDGVVFADGHNIQSDLKNWHLRTSYIPQDVYIIDDTLEANICFGMDAKNIDQSRLQSVLKEASLTDLVESLPQGTKTNVGERGTRLSGGQKQRIGIARALYKKADILFFDEATAALDNDTEREIMEAINSIKGKHTIVIIAHRLTTIEKCDYVYEVAAGAIRRVR